MGQPARVQWPATDAALTLTPAARPAAEPAPRRAFGWVGPLLLVGLMATVYLAAYARESALDAEYRTLRRQLLEEVDRTGHLRIRESWLASRTRVLQFADQEGLAAPAGTDRVPVPADCVLPTGRPDRYPRPGVEDPPPIPDVHCASLGSRR